MKTIIMTECDCHPLPSFGPLKFHHLEYEDLIHVPIVGKTKVELARPQRGMVQHGVYFVAFGYMVIVGLSVKRK